MTDMAKTGFTSAQWQEYRRMKSTDMTDAAIARVWGVAPSSMYRWSKGQGRMRASTWDRIQASEAGVGYRGEPVGKFRTITYGELSRMTQSTNPQTQRAARKELDRLAGEGYSVEQLTRMGLAGDLARPIVQRQVKGKRVRWYLGRGKSEQARKAVEEQMREQGLDPSEYSEYYDEATGYTTI